MKNFKKVLAFACACMMAFSLAACGSSGSNDETTTTSSGSSETTTASSDSDETTSSGSSDSSGTTYQIGICQLTQHDALDAASEGFMAALTELLGEDNVVFDYQDASGESTNCTTIINGFVSSDYDLILANATAALQAAVAGTDTIPILGTSITDYATALELDSFDGTVGGNVSGTSDLAPLDQQADMIEELFPDAKNVGILYCSAEPNSQFQSVTITGYLEDKGYTVTEYTFTDSNDVASVAQSAADASDVIYIPTDNTAAANTEAIANVVLAAGVPVVAGEEGICTGCGVATLSISYYDLGYATGEMAYEILVNGEDVSTMAIEYAPEVTKEYNAANCETLGITVPSDYTAIETE